MKEKKEKKQKKIPLKILIGLFISGAIIYSVYSIFIEQKDIEKLGINHIKNFEKTEYLSEDYTQYGDSQILEVSDDNYTIYYFKNPNFSIVVRNLDNLIVFSRFGKQLAISYLDKLYEERQKLLKELFSPYDGSNYALTKYIKKNLKDPDSYEHVETKFYDDGEKVLVQTQFRGKNAFGALVIQTITAFVSLDGKTVEVISLE